MFWRKDRPALIKQHPNRWKWFLVAFVAYGVLLVSGQTDGESDWLVISAFFTLLLGVFVWFPFKRPPKE